MCSVSAIMDYGKREWPGLIPMTPAVQPWVNPMTPMAPYTPTPSITPEELQRLVKDIDLGGLKKAAAEKADAEKVPTAEQIREFMKLVDAAKLFDKIAEQEHCEDPEKIKLLEAMEARLAKLEAAAAAAAAAAGKAPAVLLGSSVLASNYEIGGVTYSLGDIVARSHAESELSVAAWNEQTEAQRETAIFFTLLDMRAEVEAG